LLLFGLDYFSLVLELILRLLQRVFWRDIHVGQHGAELVISEFSLPSALFFTDDLQFRFVCDPVHFLLLVGLLGSLPLLDQPLELVIVLEGGYLQLCFVKINTRCLKLFTNRVLVLERSTGGPYGVFDQFLGDLVFEDFRDVGGVVSRDGGGGTTRLVLIVGIYTLFFLKDGDNDSTVSIVFLLSASFDGGHFLRGNNLHVGCVSV